MKNLTNNSRTVLVLLTAALIFAAAIQVKAGDKNTKQNSGIITKAIVENLQVGIQSSNEGLSRSSIFMAGFYEINELTEALVNQLAVEKNAGTRILIALSLYKIGNQAGLDAVKKLTTDDRNNEVQKMGHAILNELRINGQQVVSTEK